MFKIRIKAMKGLKDTLKSRNQTKVKVLKGVLKRI